MAILKTIPIHNIEGIVNCINYTTDEGKTTIFEDDKGKKTKVMFDKEGHVINADMEISTGVSKALSYAENIEKTAFTFDGDEDILVSGFNCGVESAAYDFMNLRYEYEEKLRAKGIDPASLIRGKKNGQGRFKGQLVDKEAREAYHIIMSFSKRSDLSPALVHMIGMEFCEKAFPDTMAVLATHMNTDHLHNHIVRSAYNMSEPTKYRDTMENLNELRSICNEISLKYGLDIIIDYGIENKHGNSFIEQLELQRGSSWKEILKQDINKAAELATSWEEFKKVMISAGYGINEKPGGVTYYFLNDENKRIRDNKLGTEFLRDNIRRKYGEPVPAVSNDAEIGLVEKMYRSSDIESVRMSGHDKSGKNINLFIPRYSVTGRRRTDAELVFLAAAKLIRHFGKEPDTKHKEAFGNNPVYHDKEDKIKTMHESRKLTELLGIRDEMHLKQMKSKCGAKKSELEGELRPIEEILKAMTVLNNKADDVMRLYGEIKERGLGNIDIKPVIYTKQQTMDKFAALMPMSPKMRRELFISLSANGYRVTVKYDSISYKDGKAAIDFIKGRSDQKPEFLVNEDEFFDRSREIKRDKAEEKIVEAKNEDLNKSFDKAVKDIPEDDRRLLYRYRVLINELLSYGYGINDIDSISRETAALSEHFLSLKDEIKVLSCEYRNLSRLEHNLNLAKNGAYTQTEGKTVDIVIDEPEVEKEKTDDWVDKHNNRDRAEDMDYKRENVFSVDDSYFDPE